MILGPSDTGGAVPMEVDRIYEKGKGKGGKKGKSKDGKSKGKGKDAQQKGKGGGQFDKSYQSKGKGCKGGGQEDKNKGKGKSKACFHCGREGHLARDCWRVRQVSDVATTASASPSAEASSTVGSSASQTQQSPKLTVKRVSQVSHGMEEPLVLGLRDQSFDECSRVRMIQFFNMAAEDTPDEVMKVHAIDEDGGDGGYSDYEFEGGTQKIILDSGSDATILPSSFLRAGRETHEKALRLQDAQGEEISIRGMKDVWFVFETENGRLVEVREKAHFADGVSQPIISYGRLMGRQVGASMVEATAWYLAMVERCESRWLCRTSPWW